MGLVAVGAGVAAARMVGMRWAVRRVGRLGGEMGGVDVGSCSLGGGGMDTLGLFEMAMGGWRSGRGGGGVARGLERIVRLGFGVWML